LPRVGAGPAGCKLEEAAPPPPPRPSSLVLRRTRRYSDSQGGGAKAKQAQRQSVDCSTLTDVSAAEGLDEVEIVSLLEETLPRCVGWCFFIQMFRSGTGTDSVLFITRVSLNHISETSSRAAHVGN
jgi:hypothetical protein